MILVIGILFCSFSISFAQIWEPDGLNMPGNWDGAYTNPPTVASLRSYNITSGSISKISVGTIRWHTTIKVAASGGDIVGGSYAWLFTSGPDGGRFNNKWAGVNVTMNTIQSYSYNTGADNSITVSDGKWYTVNWQDNGYAGTNAIFMETSGDPVTLDAVSDDYSGAGNAVVVSITTSAAPSAEEKIFVRYTTDNWSTSSFVQAAGSGTSWSATIPSGDVIGTANNQYYVLTTTVSSPTSADADMQTINLNNNGGSNYALPVELTSFTASVRSKGIELAWKTATEVNNYGFEIEKKAVSGWPLANSQQPNANNWSKIGFVEGNGTTNSPKSYNFVDVSAQGKVAYRLKQIDRDGKFEYSNVVEIASANVVTKYSLMQNHPNPFNPSTVISYQLPLDGYVTLKVYDMIGKEVATLVNGMQEAGEHTTSFNASHLPSGLYFYSLQSKNFNATKKMLLVK